MDIYRFYADPDLCPTITYVGDEEVTATAFRFRFDGKPLSPAWKPVNAKLWEEEAYKRHNTDFAALLLHVPVANEQACRCLESYLRKDAELLPLWLPGNERYYAIHVVTVIDALDTEATDFVEDDLYRRTGRISWFNSIAFRAGVIRGRHLFRIPQRLHDDIYVSDEFRGRVIECGLRGAIFGDLPGAIGGSNRGTHSDEVHDAEWVKERSMSQDEHEGIRHYIDKASVVLDFDFKSEPPRRGIEKVSKFVDLFRRNAAMSEEAERGEFINTFGCVLGEQIVREYGWHWASIVRQGGTAMGVVSPDKSRCCYPFLIMMRLLCDGSMENTTILMFNLLGGAGVASPGEYRPMW